METIIVTKHIKHENYIYLIDQNGWSYYQEFEKGPLILITTAKLNLIQKIWFKIKHIKTGLKYKK